MTRRRRRTWLILTIAAIAVVLAFLAGAVPRMRVNALVRRETAEMAVPTVAVVHPKPAAPSQEILLPGNIQAWADAPIFARASGYVKVWYTDIGARVKRNQVLAVIEAPELDQQLFQARGTLATSIANLKLSQITERRNAAALQQHAVSQQDYDNAAGALAANKATVDANEANVRQLEQLVEYLKVRAPFDGTITARNIDIGDLITAGNSTTTGPELFHIVQAEKLRVFVSVPELYARSALPGLNAELSLQANPGVRFTGTLVRTAKAIDPTTRTLNVEIEVDNPGGAVYAGAFAEVHIKVPTPTDTYILPIETLVFRKEGLQVASVQDGKVELKSITPGHDFGDRIEVVHGLTASDTVIVNPPDSIATGQRVQIAQAR